MHISIHLHSWANQMHLSLMRQHAPARMRKAMLDLKQALLFRSHEQMHQQGLQSSLAVTRVGLGVLNSMLGPMIPSDAQADLLD